MTDTLWSDISEFNSVVNDSYPYHVLSFRSNDGTYHDPHFAANLAWSKAAVKSGKLAFYIVYGVWRPDGGAWATTLMQMVGKPDPRLVVMMDVESWDGEISGNRSAAINADRARLATWLGDSRRVIGYGNEGDLNALWPSRGDAKLVVAAYGFNPAFPGKIAHQFTDHANVAPFGSCDLNSADGFTLDALMEALGLSGAPAVVTPVPAPAPAPSPYVGRNITTRSVKSIQVRVGLTGSDVDGIYGPKTTAYVEKFQRAFGLTVDGIWGPLTDAVAFLRIDGDLGPNTIRNLQHVLGTPVDGVISSPDSTVVRAVQVALNVAKARDWDGKQLIVDGAGLASNTTARVGKFRTVYALQKHLGTTADGYLDKGDSLAVRALQRRLSSGKF